MVLMRTLYLFLTISFSLCSTAIQDKMRIPIALNDFEENFSQSNRDIDEEMNNFEEEGFQTEQERDNIPFSGSRTDSSSKDLESFEINAPGTVGKQEYTKNEDNDYSTTSGDEEIVTQTSTLSQKENSNSSETAHSSGFYNKHFKEDNKKTDANVFESGDHESKELNDGRIGNAVQNKLLGGSNADEKFKANTVDTFSGMPEAVSVSSLGTSKIDNGVTHSSGDVEDENDEKSVKVNIKSNAKRINESLRNSNTSQKIGQTKLLTREELIRFLAEKIIGLRNISLKMQELSKVKENSATSEKNHTGSKEIQDQTRNANGKIQEIAATEKNTNNGKEKKQDSFVGKETKTTSQSKVLKHNGNEAKVLPSSLSPAYHSLSDSHLEIDKISQRQPENYQDKAQKVEIHIKTKNAEKEQEKLAKEEEKKLIALSATDKQVTSENKDKPKPSQPEGTKATKDVKQGDEFIKEKEKKLIEQSIHLSTMDAQKTNKSKQNLDQQGAAFRTRYFGKQVEKVTKKYKEDKLLKALEALKFGNKPSTVNKAMTFKNLKQCGLFVEDYNVSRTSASWNTRLFSQYSYLYEIPQHFSECSTTGWFNRTDMRGSVFLSFQVRSILGNTMMNNARVCAKYCCREPRCRAWTVRIQEGETRNCDKGSYCCWLKSAVPDIRSGVDNCTSGLVSRVNTKDPPIGMRSAVPLGGLSTGSFELRADGSFHEWTIENQSPGGSAKLNKGSLDMAVFGVRVAKKNRSEAALLRTHPPYKYPGVEELSYSGAYPVSKLSPGGNITELVGIDLYAYPVFHPRDPYSSAVPAVAFTIGLENKDNKEPITTSFLLNLPLGYQDDTIRMGDNYGEVVFTRNILPADCARACAKMPKCMAWTTNGPTACLLKDKMPLHAWTAGIISGVKGEWTQNNSMLTLERPGFFPQSGSTTLYAVDGHDKEISFAVADDFKDIWKNFNKTGLAGNKTSVTRVGLHGSASIRTTLQPGQKKSLTIIMSWYYPHRDMAKVHIGNFYTNMFQSSQSAAIHMRKNLLKSVSSILTWQKPFLLSGEPSSEAKTIVYRLPSWLSDMLVNSVSFWRSAFWTKDGRWRQWEAYDCNDIDTIHNDMQRILPYMLFYPEVVRHLLLSWAGNQYSNGMMQEALTQGCLGRTGKLDYAGGRVMADSTSMFVAGVYQYYKWTDDKMILEKLWPSVKRAITWLIIESTKGTGLPFRKATFYDLAGIDKYDHHIYDSVVFMLALRAARALATITKDDNFKQMTDAAISRAESLIEKEFWIEHFQHYRAWWDVEYGASDWIMSDSFYGQVWANTLGLGDLVPRKNLKRHLEAEAIINNTPWGLRVISTNKPAVSDEDTSLILSHRLPGCKSLENITKHDSIWMGADSDWTSLMINLDTHPQWALEQAKKSLDHWRSTLKDQWNIHGLMSSGGYGQDGLPWASSHHNSHLVMWHIPIAISGQQYSAPELALTFWPKVEIPFELPFFVPTASGLIEGKFGGDSGDEEVFTFKVTSGQIHLKHLKILGSAYGNGEIHLKKGSAVTWSRPRQNVWNILNELK